MQTNLNEVTPSNKANTLSLKEIQDLSKEILFKFDDICTENGFKYYLAMGTLLGAVRHNGFIPWDDDIDVWMPRRDYCSFIEYMANNSSNHRNLHLFTNHDKNYPYMISRLCNTDYKCCFDNEKDYGLGLFIDIYPLDGIGNTVREAKRRNKLASVFSSLCWLSTRNKLKIERTRGVIKLLLKFPAFIAAKLLGKQFFFKRLEKMSRQLP